MLPHKSTIQLLQELDEGTSRTPRPERIAKSVALANMSSVTDAAGTSETNPAVVVTNERIRPTFTRKDDRIAYYRNNSETLIGARVSIWYPDYGEHFLGRVDAYHPGRRGKNHWRVSFDQGSHAFIDLDTVLNSEVSSG